MNLKEIILVFIGGGSGSLVRYGLGKLFTSMYTSPFPWATLLVNILASLLLGLFLSIVSNKQITNLEWKLLVAVGFCGGFSTFSTFSNETLQLLRMGQVSLALLNITLSVLLCIGATYLGFVLTK